MAAQRGHGIVGYCRLQVPIPTVPIPTIHIRQNASEKAQLTLTLTLTLTLNLALTLTLLTHYYPFRNVGIAVVGIAAASRHSDVDHQSTLTSAAARKPPVGF